MIELAWFIGGILLGAAIVLLAGMLMLRVGELLDEADRAQIEFETGEP